MANSQILLRNPVIKHDRYPHEDILKFEIVGCCGNSSNVFSVTKDSLHELIVNDYPDITCVGFVCCTESSLDDMLYLCKYLKLNTDLKTLWYNESGNIIIDKDFKTLQWLDYIFIHNWMSRFRVVNLGCNNGFELEKII